MLVEKHHVAQSLVFWFTGSNSYHFSRNGVDFEPILLFLAGSLSLTVNVKFISLFKKMNVLETSYFTNLQRS